MVRSGSLVRGDGALASVLAAVLALLAECTDSFIPEV